MDINYLNAIRLGFSTVHAKKIKEMGLKSYINEQLNGNYPLKMPDFFENSPKTIQEMREYRRKMQAENKEAQKNAAKNLIRQNIQVKEFLLKRCYETSFPVREKINLFFQNHFVATLKSVKLPYWIFTYYKTINEYALKNYKTLVTEMVYSNAIIKYLDNQKNTNGNINENLARELLELFTLGEGNYSEEDIKNTAKALAGLTFGNEKGQYRPALKDNSIKTVFGKSGNFIIDDVIDLIFEQKNTPYFLAKKALKWFFYDNPSQEKVQFYGDILKQNQFELKPFFEKLFEEECKDEKGGNQIKNPFIFLFQVFNDLNLKPHYTLFAIFLRNQGMDILDQPNVKGWKGGQDWLTSQIYLNRNQLIDFIIDGNKRYIAELNRRLEKFSSEPITFNPKFKIEHKKNAKTIIDELTQKTIFSASEELQNELNQVLKYDFNPESENAERSILKVYQHIAQSPEFQII